MPRKIYGEWITIRAIDLSVGDVDKAGILNCSRCGQDMQIMLPMELNNLWRLAGPFGSIHNECEPNNEE